VRIALVIAAKELRQRLRDRSAFVIGFLAPFALAAILSLSLSQVDDEDFETTFGLVDLDGGEVSGEFTRLLDGLEFAEVREIETEAQAERLAEDGDVQAAFVIPDGFSEALRSARPAEVRVVGAPDAEISTLIARSIAEGFAAELNAVALSIRTVLSRGPPPGDLQELGERAQEERFPVTLDTESAQSRVFGSTTYYAAGMAVFFVFFVVEFGARSLLNEREEGTMARLLAAPIAPAWIVLGKSLAAFVVGLVSVTSLVVASGFLLGAEWGDPIGVAALVVAAVVAAMGITALVSTLAKTSQQASSYASVAAVVLGLLGGTFFPVSQGPGFLSLLSRIAPHAWLMEGFGDLSGGGTDVVDVLPSVAVVVGFGVVTGAIAVARSRRLVPR
jgi:ABC-2 type transport system permease protein